jgi:hypothetical protein
MGAPSASFSLRHSKKKTPRGHMDRGATTKALRCSASLHPPPILLFPPSHPFFAVSRKKFPTGGGARKGGGYRWIYRRRSSRVWAPADGGDATWEDVEAIHAC